MVRSYTAAEASDAAFFLEVSEMLSTDDEQSSSGDEEIQNMFIMAACEPYARSVYEEIGPERLSIARLRRGLGANACHACRMFYLVFSSSGWSQTKGPR